MRYRWYAFILLLVATAAAVPWAQRAMVPDNALTVWFLEDDPGLAAYRAFHAQFGNDEVVLLGYRRAEGIVAAGTLRRLRTLARRLEALDGVARVYALTNVQDLVREGRTTRLQTLVPDTLSDAPEVRARLHASPLVRDRLLDATGTTTLLWLEMAVMDDFDARREAVLAEVRAVADDVLGPGAAHLGGMGVIYAGLNEITRHDFGLFIGLSYVLMAAVLYLLFRRVAFVLLALAVVGTALLLTLGVYGLAGGQVNMVTVMLPTLVTIFGLADVIHLLNQYAGLTRRLAPGASRARRAACVRQTLRRVFRPCLYTSLTTAAGFLALTATEMAVLRDLGLYAALGIGGAFLATLVFAAALLPHVAVTAEAGRSTGAVDRVGGMLGRFTERLGRRPGRYALLTAALAAVGLVGAGRIVVDTYTLGYLPEEHRVVRDHRFLERYWGPYATLELTIHPTGGRDLRDPAVLQAMAAFSEEVAGLEGVRGAFGLHTLLLRFSDGIYGDDRLLRDRRQADAFLRGMGRRADEDLRRLVTPDYRVGRLTLTGAMVSARTLQRSMAQVRAVAARHFDGLATVRFAGYPPLYVRIIDYVMAAQIQSFYLALLLIFGLMALLLRDLRLALVAMVPNLFPVVLMLGAMGWLGIPLDVATATVAAIVLGIAVDDTIHLLYHLQQHRQAPGGLSAALGRTMAGVGRSVVFTSLVLALGFSVLLFAAVKTVFYFGLLTALAVVGALVGDLILLPLLLKAAYPKDAVVDVR